MDQTARLLRVIYYILNLMKIAVFIPSLTGGGAERVAVILANEFAALGNTTRLLVATNAPPEYTDEVNDSVTLYFFSASRTIKSVPKLARYINKDKPDALLAIMDHASITASIALLLSGRKKNTRFFVREAVSLDYKEAQLKGYRRIFKKTLKEQLISRTYRTADGVISPSHKLGQALHKKYAPQIKVSHINNPVVTTDFIQHAAEKINLPWKTKQATIVAAGRFTAQKNFLCLLQAFSRVRLKIDCKLILLGTGPDQSNIERYIKANDLNEHCYLPGFVKNPLPYFASSDTYVLSSDYEGSPNVLIQALACGTAAVSTNCPTGPAEILVDGEYGKLVPVGDYVKIAEAIVLTLLTLDKAKQSDIATIVLDKYDSRKIARQYASLLDSVPK